MLTQEMDADLIHASLQRGDARSNVIQETVSTVSREAVETAEKLIRTPLFTSLKRGEDEKVEFISTSLKRGVNDIRSI